MEVRFVVLGPPQPKQRPRRATLGPGNKRAVWYTPKPTKLYEEWVGLSGWKALEAAGLWASWPRRASYEVDLRIVRRMKRKLDVDNVAKSVLDGLNRVLWEDDSMVRKLSAEMLDPDGTPRVEVFVRALEGA